MLKIYFRFFREKKDPRPFHESWINQNLPGSIITISNVNYDGVMRDERLCDITWKSYWIYTTTSTYYLTEKKWYYIYFSDQTNGNFENNFLVILKKDNHNSMMLHMKNMAWCIHFFITDNCSRLVLFSLFLPHIYTLSSQRPIKYFNSSKSPSNSTTFNTAWNRQVWESVWTYILSWFKIANSSING